MLTTYLPDLHVRTFSHRKTCVTNQNISRWYKHVSQKAKLSFGKKFKFLKLFSSRKPEYLVGTLLTLYSLWGRFFLPIGQIDQGMTHLRRLCVTVGAASQISYMLTEAICFYNTKYHLDLCRTIITKTLLKFMN